MDSEIVSTAQCLTKRYADTSGFLGESAEQALLLMIDNVSAARSLGALVAASESRNALVRGRCGCMLFNLIARRGAEVVHTREMENLRVRLPKLLSDQTPEARAYARRIVFTLVNEGHLSRSDLEQTISTDQIEKSMKEDKDISLIGSGVGGMMSSPKVASSPSRRAISGRVASGRNASRKSPKVSKSLNFDPDDPQDTPSTMRDVTTTNLSVDIVSELPSGGRLPTDFANLRISTGTGSTGGAGGLASPAKRTPSSTHSAAGSVGSVDSRPSPSPGKIRSSAKRQMEAEPGLLQLGDWMSMLNTNNWLDRVDALTSITDAVLNFTDILKNCGKLNSCMDAIIERLQDGSVKCVLHTLQCLHKINRTNPSLLGENKILTAQLMTSASSTNRQISREATDILDSVLDQTSPSSSLAQLATMALHEKDRLRAAAFRVLADRVAEYHAISDSTLKRSLFPSVSKTLLGPSTKAEVRVAAAECLKAMQKCLGDSDQVHLWVSDYTQREEIKRLSSAV